MKRVFIYFIVLLLAACGGEEQKLGKTPIDDLIRDMDSIQNFTIILFDMDAEDSKYKHRYKIITENMGTVTVENDQGLDSSYKELIPEEKLTAWYDVQEVVFDHYIKDMGMEVASKTDGKVSKTVSPPGYSQYVGNERYGSWKKDDSGNSFWEFYGKYMFISSMFNLLAGPPIYRSHYGSYRTSYLNGRSYYGPTTGGQSRYGTFSQSNRNSNFSRKMASNNTFKSRINNSVQRSSARTRSGSRSASKSGSRYSGSSSRSRSSSSGGK